MSDYSAIFDALGRGLSLAVLYWWAWLPIVLAAVAYETWFDYQRTKFIAGLKWMMLEVIPPPEILYSSPRAAENIFAGLHASYAGFPGTSWKSQFFQGKVPVAFSFEIISDGGDTHFYIRCLEDQRNVIESLIFAQYPQAEVRPVSDYIDLLPPHLDLDTYDVSGAELEFTKDQAYPIKSYVEFEEAGGKDEYARLDPIAPLLEIMTALRPGEYLWLQYIVRATGGDWVKEGQKVVDELSGKPKKEPEEPLVLKILSLPFVLLESLLMELGAVPPKAEEKKKDEKEFNLQKLTPAQKKVLEQVEYKLAKLGFKAGIRLLYTARKDAFDGSRIASVTAMFKQLYYNNLNTFKPGNHTRDKGYFKWIFPSDKGFLAGERVAKKKVRMYDAYRKREFPKKKFPKTSGPELLVFLNTEELATLWHLPGLNVKAPLLPRVEAKKGQPPASLPTR
jgi:hypothetical protein